MSTQGALKSIYSGKESILTPFLCGYFGAYLSNSHMARNCPSMSDLRQRKHNSTATLLFDLLNKHTKGTWITVAKDTGRHPPHNFDQGACLPELREVPNPPIRQASTRREDIDEGLIDDMARCCSTIIPEWILPKHLLPNHCKPDIIRITCCTMKGNNLTPTLGSTPELHIIEFK